MALAGALLVGCGSSAPAFQPYTYPGCPDAGDTEGCVGRAALGCARATIAAKHDTCSVDADCTTANVDGKCMGFCPSVVAASDAQAFVSEFGAEIDRYCANALCTGGPDCASVEPVCVTGHCAAR